MEPPTAAPPARGTSKGGSAAGDDPEWRPSPLPSFRRRGRHEVDQEERPPAPPASPQPGPQRGLSFPSRGRPGTVRPGLPRPLGPRPAGSPRGCPAVRSAAPARPDLLPRRRLRPTSGACVLLPSGARPPARPPLPAAPRPLRPARTSAPAAGEARTVAAAAVAPRSPPGAASPGEGHAPGRRVAAPGGGPSRARRPRDQGAALRPGWDTTASPARPSV